MNFKIALGSGIFWLCLVIAGQWMLLRYASAPAQIANAPLKWPALSTLPLNKEGKTLLVFIHPQCPCSRASLRELEKIVARTQENLQATLVFIRHESLTQQPLHTSLWAQAKEISKVKIFDDFKGLEAKQFGAKTSGQTLLYDSKGSLLFNGGITASRGHEGDNLGAASIVSLLKLGHADKKNSFVFGCALFNKKNTLEEK